jgi:hypothetical protein
LRRPCSSNHADRFAQRPFLCQLNYKPKADLPPPQKNFNVCQVRPKPIQRHWGYPCLQAHQDLEIPSGFPRYFDLGVLKKVRGRFNGKDNRK